MLDTITIILIMITFLLGGAKFGVMSPENIMQQVCIALGWIGVWVTIIGIAVLNMLIHNMRDDKTVNVYKEVEK